jgi:hypothetical protein
MIQTAISSSSTIRPTLRPARLLETKDNRAAVGRGSDKLKGSRSRLHRFTLRNLREGWGTPVFLVQTRSRALPTRHFSQTPVRRGCRELPVEATRGIETHPGPIMALR